MMEETSYGIRRDGSIKQKRKADGNGGREVSNVIRIAEPGQPLRHGVDEDGSPLPYKGYVGGNNYCVEITRSETGRWAGEVVSTFEAYQLIRSHGTSQLRHPSRSAHLKPLVMRLMIGDTVRIETNGETKLIRVVKIDPSTNVVFAAINEAGELKKRHDDRNDLFRYVNLRGDSFRSRKARHVTISPIGELRDPGFRE